MVTYQSQNILEDNPNNRVFLLYNNYRAIYMQSKYLTSESDYGIIYIEVIKVEDVKNGFKFEHWPYKLFKKHDQYYMTYYHSGEFEITKEGFFRRLKKLLEKTP